MIRRPGAQAAPGESLSRRGVGKVLFAHLKSESAGLWGGTGAAAVRRTASHMDIDWHGCHIEPPCLTNTFFLCDLKDLYVRIYTYGSEELVVQVL